METTMTATKTVLSALHGEPVTMLDWALHWQRQGLFLFPCSKFLGDPLIKDWHASASAKDETVINWWSKWPDADIGVAPDRSGHFVVVAVMKEGGYDSLAAVRDELPELDFERWSPWREHFLWFKSAEKVQTSHHRLGQGLHVLGPGSYCYLPNSRAPFV
jgi:Bifunctional DNA primase/polymerase, N-terminal